MLRVLLILSMGMVVLSPMAGAPAQEPKVCTLSAFELECSGDGCYALSWGYYDQCAPGTRFRIERKETNQVNWTLIESSYDGTYYLDCPVNSGCYQYKVTIICGGGVDPGETPCRCTSMCAVANWQCLDCWD